MKQKLGLPSDYSPHAVRRACACHVPSKFPLEYQEPEAIFWDDQKYRGDAYGAYSWAVYVAEVSVDSLTGEIRVDRFTALQEVGRVLHPFWLPDRLREACSKASASHYMRR